MKNNGFTVLLVLIGLTLGTNLHASGAQPRPNRGSHTVAFVLQGSKDSQSAELEQLPVIAKAAFDKLSPATQKWFVTTAAQHPAGSFDGSWTVKALMGQFSGTQMGDNGEIMVCLMAYLKDVAKEVRENRNIRRSEAELELRRREAKAVNQTQAIEQGRKEAGERFEHAMTAADKEMWLGVMSTLGTALNSGLGSVVDSKRPQAKADDKELQQAVIKKLLAQLAKLRASDL